MDTRLVQIPTRGGTGWTRQFVYDMWVRAGRPPINSAGRLYTEQKEAWDKYQNGTGSPADNPDRPDLYNLAHVRGIALDVDPQYRPGMQSAGFWYRLSYEPWHAEAVPAWDIRDYPIVSGLPWTSGSGGNPFPTDPSITSKLRSPAMEFIVRTPAGDVYHIVPGVKFKFTSAGQYNTWRRQLAKLRAGGGTNAMPMPALEAVPDVDKGQFEHICRLNGVDTAS